MADLKVGDLIEVGFSSNYGQKKIIHNINLTPIEGFFYIKMYVIVYVKQNEPL